MHAPVKIKIKSVFRNFTKYKSFLCLAFHLILRVQYCRSARFRPSRPCRKWPRVRRWTRTSLSRLQPPDSRSFVHFPYWQALAPVGVAKFAAAPILAAAPMAAYGNARFSLVLSLGLCICTNRLEEEVWYRY